MKPANDGAAKRIAAKKELARVAARELEFNDRKVQEHANDHRYASAAIASSLPKLQKSPAVAPPAKPTTPIAKPPAAAVATSSAKRKSKDAPIAVAPKAKKAKARESDVDLSIDPTSVINRRVAKTFEGQIFFGTVSSFDVREQLWQIDYDDGDEEEFDQDELKVHLRMQELNKDVDKKGKSAK